MLPFGDFVIYNRNATPDLDLTNPTTKVSASDTATNVADKPNPSNDIPTSTDPKKSKTKSLTEKLNSAGDFNFPILNDPAQVFNLLLGKPAVLMTYDLKPLVFDFKYTQFFPIFGPLGAGITAEFGATACFIIHLQIC